MLTYEDKPIIERMVHRRLNEPGKTELIEIRILHKPQYEEREIKDALGVVIGLERIKLQEDVSHIQVGIWWILRDRIQDSGLISGTSFFDLPEPWERQHVLNEIDEIADQLKKIRARTLTERLLWAPGRFNAKKFIEGSGLRSRWPGRVPEPLDRITSDQAVN